MGPEPHLGSDQTLAANPLVRTPTNPLVRTVETGLPLKEFPSSNKWLSWDKVVLSKTRVVRDSDS